jgi:hypothetical protein
LARAFPGDSLASKQDDDASDRAALAAIRANERQMARHRAKDPRRRRAIRRLNAMAIWGFLLGLFGAISLGIGIYYMSASDQSSFTQSHGVRDTATVTNVDNQQNCGPRVSCYWTAAVSAVLRTPVAGHDTTTVHIPNKVSYGRGQVVTALVDPSDPRYAEIPGSRFQGMPSMALTVVGVILLVIAIALITLAIRLQNHIIAADGDGRGRRRTR